MRVNFTGQNTVNDLYFSQLKLRETFRINTPMSRGAVYMKVIRKGSTERYYMLEVATGNLLHPTSSPVIPIESEINIRTSKPAIYK